jgi:hypothetical protein
MTIGEIMAKAATDQYPGHMTLAEFLDTLPRTPCEQTPQNKHFCTVCERLNKGVAARCKYSKVEDEEGADQSGVDSGSVDFIPVSDGKGAPDKLEPSAGIGASTSAQGDTEKVEFKVVAPLKSDDDFPMLELVQPKDKQIKPIEMELLENVAIEFTPTEDSDGSEAVEVEALEVEPIEGEDEFEGEYGDEDIGDDSAFEVEVLEVAELADDETDSEVGDTSIPQFKPLDSQGAPMGNMGSGPGPGHTQAQDTTPMAVDRPKLKKKSIKKKKVSEPKTLAPTFTPITPAAASSPTPKPTTGPQAAPRPTPTTKPTPTPTPTATGHQTQRSPQLADQQTVPRYQPQLAHPQQKPTAAPSKLKPVRKTKPKKVKKVIKRK